MFNKLKKALFVSLVTLFTFTGFTAIGAASASEVNSSMGKVSKNRVDTQSMPKSIYLSNVARNTSNEVIPPAKITHTIHRDGVRYTGTLIRTDYASVGDGRYLALYSGYVYR